MNIRHGLQLGLALLMALAGCARAPEGTDTTTTRPADQLSQGPAWTGEQLAGVWVQTRAAGFDRAKVLTITTDGTFVLEGGGRPAYGVEGTYQVQGDTITFTPSRPDWECPLMKWTGRHPGGGEAVPDAVDFEYLINDTGPCTGWMRVAFVRISPRSPETDLWELQREAAGSGQAPRAPSLRRMAGIWAQDDGELVLRIGRDGEYTIGVGEASLTDPADTGTISFGDGGTIEFTSGPESRTCAEGTVMTWRQVRVSREGIPATGLDAEGDPCGGLPGGPTSWHNLIRY